MIEMAWSTKIWIIVLISAPLLAYQGVLLYRYIWGATRCPKCKGKNLWVGGIFSLDQCLCYNLECTRCHHKWFKPV